MKTFLTLAFVGFLTLTGIAQSTSTVNITFRGINKGTNNYQVMIDQDNYYSNNNTGNVPNYRITISNFPIGTHSLKVYRLKNNNPAYNTTSQNTFVYQKNFELSQGYDMNIVILANGLVQFTEQPSALDNTQTTVYTPMADYDFSQLLQNMRNRSQSIKVTGVRNAFTNTNNYFSTAQIRQLLALITSESNRLALAKISYRSVADPYNFTTLSDMFASTANRNEFNNYVSMNATQPVNNGMRVPMTDYAFNQLIQNVQNNWSQSLKAETIRNAFMNTNNYFSTAQTRQLLVSITSESDRLDLAKLAYRNVTDPLVFSQLSDLFNSNSYRTEFNNYVSINNGQSSGTTRVSMADYQFNQLLQNVRNQWSTSLKAQVERDAFVSTENYFSTSQIRQLLSLITSESDRLDLAKLSYRGVTDPTYFNQLSDLFYTASYRNDFNNYVATQGGQVINATIRTAMSDSDFNALVFSIKSNLLQFLKVSAERDVFNNSNYFFTTNQVKQLISLINSENNRLELAKLSYHTIVDPANYTILYDLFQVQANKDDLTNYVKANQVL